MNVLVRRACSALFAAAVACPVLAQTARGAWDFPEKPGWAKPVELVFSVPATGIVHLEGEIRPYCACGRGGFGYFQFEHRIAGRSEWKAGLPRELGATGHSHKPTPWVDGQPAWDVYELRASEGAGRYELRVVVRPNALWRDGGYVTPAQSLAVSVFPAVMIGEPTAQPSAAPAAGAPGGAATAAPTPPPPPSGQE